MSEISSSQTPGIGFPKRRSGLRGFLVLLAVLLIAGGLLLAVLMGWVMPKQYESTAVIQVMGGTEGLSGCFQDPQMNRVEVEARRVVGLPTFERVKVRLNLEEHWEADGHEVIERLRKMVTAQVREGTDLIEITVRHRNAMDARDVALGMAEEYRDLRGEEETLSAERALDVLDDELKAQEDRVEEGRKMLDRFLDGSGMSIEEAVEEAVEKQVIYRSEEKNLLELHAEEGELKQLLQGFGGLRGVELYEWAASLELPQNSVSVLWEQYATVLREKEDLLEGGLAAGHPRVVSSELQLSMLEGDLATALKRMREVTERQLQYLATRIALLDKFDEEHKEKILLLWAESSEYSALKRAYEDEQQHLQRLKLEHSSKRIGLRIKRGVVIAEPPWIGKEPVGPDMYTYLTIGAGAGGAVAMVASVLVWRDRMRSAEV